MKKKLITVTDEELFYSKWLKKEYEDTGLALTGRTDPRIVVKLMRSLIDEDCFLARTNGKTVQVHPFASPLAGLSRNERYAVLYGVVVHEIAHILYTDFRCHIFINGSMAFKTKSRILTETGVSISDIDYTCSKWIASLENNIEDGFIENAFISDYAGVPSIYLKRARKYMAKGYEPVAVMYKKQGLSAQFVSNCTLIYSTTGRLDFTGFPSKGVLAKKMVSLMEIIDDAVVDTDQISRWVAAAKIYKLFEEAFQEAAAKGDAPSYNSSDVDGNHRASAPETPKSISDHRRKTTKAPSKEKSEDTDTDTAAPSSTDETESGDEDKDARTSSPDTPEKGSDKKETKAETSDSGKKDADEGEEPSAGTETDKDHEADSEKPDADGSEDGEDKKEDCSSAEPSTGDGDDEGGEDVDFDRFGGDDETEADLGFDDDGIMDDLKSSVSRVMKGVAEEKEEEETKAERGEDAKGIPGESSGDFKLVPVNPQPWKDAETTDATGEYAKVIDEVRPVSKRLQRSLISELQDREYGSKRSGLLVGKRFEAKNAHRMDMRTFATNKAPTELKSLAVAVLVDLSGSMSRGARMQAAIKTSVLVQDFCSGLKYPVAVYGHASDREGCNVYTFTEWSDKGKEMIADMEPMWDNHDGHALRYVKKRLLRRPEPNKLLIYISDGEPWSIAYAGVRYCGDRAVDDLKNFMKEAKKDNVTLICAGIGDDKEALARIYGDAFMDISDLSRLPVLIVRCLKRLIQQVE